MYHNQHSCAQRHKLSSCLRRAAETPLEPSDIIMTKRRLRLRGQKKTLLVFQAAAFCAVAVALGIGFQSLRDFGRIAHGPRKASFLVTQNDYDGIKVPHAMLWAWERPEDLRGLDTKKAGVAFLAGTIFLRPVSPNDDEDLAKGVVLRPRLQPLRVPDGARLMAVVRIEMQQGWPQSSYPSTKQTEGAPPDDSYTEGQRHLVVWLINRLVVFPEVRAVQIDFDATRSQRGFYRALLVELRRALPPQMPISITALASWCIGDPWLEQLPPGTINEAVPMLFRMGSDTANVTSFLSKGKEFLVPLCRGSLGISTDEDFSKDILNGELEEVTDRGKKKRVYLFQARAWDQDSLEQTIGALKRWHEESGLQ